MSRLDTSSSDKVILHDDKDYVNVNETDALSDHPHELKRSLKDRHISLLALAGIVGPGILIGASLGMFFKKIKD